MRWRIVEQRVWEMEADTREEALKVFKGAEAPPPHEINLSSEDWWTEERCERLSDLIRAELERRLGVCDPYRWETFGPWMEKAQKVVSEAFGVSLYPYTIDDADPKHDGRWGKGESAKVGVYIFFGEDSDGDSTEWDITLPESDALKVMILGGF